MADKYKYASFRGKIIRIHPDKLPQVLEGDTWEDMKPPKKAENITFEFKRLYFCGL